jgi:Phage integrase, N-terminal SAM-like domain
MSSPTVSLLRQRMIDDMRARKLGRHSERSHIHSCKRFAAYLKRSPETATADDVKKFQLSLVENDGLTIPTNRQHVRMVRIGISLTRRPRLSPHPPSCSDLWRCRRVKDSRPSRVEKAVKSPCVVAWPRPR